MSEVHDKAFGRSLGLTRHQLLARLAEDPDAVPAVLALAGDVPVSAARMETHPGTDFASLWGGGTVAEWRGRGSTAASSRSVRASPPSVASAISRSTPPA